MTRIATSSNPAIVAAAYDALVQVSDDLRGAGIGDYWDMLLDVIGMVFIEVDE